MKKLLLILVVIFISSFAGAKNSYLFNKVLVNGAYEQAIYPSADIIYLHPGEKYFASYYLSAGFVSGNTVIEVLAAPDYLEFAPIFNDSIKTGFHFYWANNESGQEAFFRTTTTANGFTSSWLCFRYPSRWLGDVEFINQLKVGDSIQYRVSSVCDGLNNQSYHNYHLRTIKCIADTALKLGQTTGVPKFPELQISAFPNPFASELTINSFQNIDVSILDLSGRVLESRRLYPGLTRISTAGLKPGIYFLQAGKTAIRLIKQ